ERLERDVVERGTALQALLELSGAGRQRLVIERCDLVLEGGDLRDLFPQVLEASPLPESEDFLQDHGVTFRDATSTATSGCATGWPGASSLWSWRNASRPGQRLLGRPAPRCRSWPRQAAG